MIGRMKTTTTTTTIMEWVVNPSVGRNDLADILITSQCRSFLAFITHTLETSIIFAAIYMSHCIDIHITNAPPTLIQDAFPILALPSKARVVFDPSVQVIPPKTCPKKSSSL